MKQPLPDEIGDVVIVQLAPKSWQLQDRVGAILDGHIFASLDVVRRTAFDLAERQDGQVWLHELGTTGLMKLKK
jgi:hypothetical protein